MPQTLKLPPAAIAPASTLCLRCHIYTLTGGHCDHHTEVITASGRDVTIQLQVCVCSRNCARTSGRPRRTRSTIQKVLIVCDSNFFAFLFGPKAYYEHVSHFIYPSSLKTFDSIYFQNIYLDINNLK